MPLPCQMANNPPTPPEPNEPTPPQAEYTQTLLRLVSCSSTLSSGGQSHRIEWTLYSEGVCVCVCVSNQWKE